MDANVFHNRVGKAQRWCSYRRREFTALSVAMHPRQRQSESPRGVVTMSQLGRLGRFGNWVFQYMFLKCHCWRFGFESQTPHWPGHDLFDCDDPLLAGKLPVHLDPVTSAECNRNATRLLQPVENVDLQGFFQYHTSFYAPYRQRLQDLFTPKPTLRHRLNSAMSRLRSAGRTLVALHIRRGDYGEDQFYITPTSWYLAWLEKIWPTLDQPVLYIATDEPSVVVPDFDRFPLLTSRDLPMRVRQAPYFVDFSVLTQADVLAIPNSTFSFAASMLNKKLTIAYRSQLSDPLLDPPFREFDPWNSVVLDEDSRVEKFPNIPGIRRAG